MNKDERGIAMVMAMVFLVFFTLLTLALSTLVVSETRFLGFDHNRIVSDYAAQAGAKIAIDNIKTWIAADTNGTLDTSALQGGFTGKITTQAGSPQYTVTFKPVTLAGNTIPNYIEITATGTYNGVKSNVVARILFGEDQRLSPNPGVMQLLSNTKDFSKKEPWLVTGEVPNQICRPPTNSNNSYKQVLFHETLSEQFKISYNITLDQTTAVNSGYGIYYNASGTADNPTAYVFQYDPGAILSSGDGGAFFVKKNVAKSSTPANSYENEVWELSNRNYRHAFQDNGKDDLGNERGIARVSINEFISTMNTYYAEMKATGKKRSDGSSYPDMFFLTTDSARDYYCGDPARVGKTLTPAEIDTYSPYARHTISIEAKNDEVATTVKYYKYTTSQVWNSSKKRWETKTTKSVVTETKKLKQQYVACDGKEILKFVDLDTKNPIPTSNSGTGLRVWDARVTFNNNISDSYGQVVADNLMWINPRKKTQ
jgi:hypothetical protein